MIKPELYVKYWGKGNYWLMKIRQANCWFNKTFILGVEDTLNANYTNKQTNDKKKILGIKEEYIGD